jgi:hypothetical protein
MKNGYGTNSPHSTQQISNPSKTRKGIEVTQKFRQNTLTRKHTPIKELTALLAGKNQKIKLTLDRIVANHYTAESEVVNLENKKFKPINRLEPTKAPQLKSQQTQKKQIEKLDSLSIQNDKSELRIQAIISKDSNDEPYPGRIEINQTLKKNSLGNFSNNIGNRTGAKIFFTYSNPQSV